MEWWKTIKGFEGKYEVSDLGRVRRIERYKRNEYGEEEKLPDKIITPSEIGRYSESRYLSVGLIRNGVTERHYVHRLVANAFIPNKKRLPTVNHIDLDKSNNDVRNLEWMSYKDNTQHALKHYGGTFRRDLLKIN